MNEDALITISQAGAFVLVAYQGRKSSHLYLALENEPAFCCQCSANLPATADALVEHFWTHAPKRLQAKRARQLAKQQ